jgi:zinc protease
VVAALFAALLPAAAPVPAGAAPAIEHWRSDAGPPVYFVAAPDLPIVDLRVTVDAGSARDGDAGGLAALAARVMSEGAGQLDAQQIDERFAQLGVEFQTRVERDTAAFSIRSLSDRDRLGPAIELLAGILTQPALADDAIERERARLLREFERRSQSPGRRADDALFAAIYGGHPYGSPVAGDRGSLARLTAAQVREFYRKHYVREAASIAIVGDVDAAAARALAERAGAALAPGPPPAPIPDAPGAPAAASVSLPHDATQTHVRIGHIGMRVGDPDYFPLYVGNHVLGGGGLVSRLFEEVREDRGLSYSAYSYFQPLAVAGPFYAGASTRNDQLETALAAIRDTMRGFIEHGPTEAELERAKRNIVGGFPLRIDTNAKVLEYLAMIARYGLPLDYLETFPRRVEAVTVEAVREAFRRRLGDDGGYVTVLVGGAVRAAPGAS